MSSHILKLQPTDILFFKDGRPMDGASSGHGAAWPLPNVLDSALHAALHRTGFQNEAHSHNVGCSSDRKREEDSTRTRYFGSLQCAGPFPISDKDDKNQWYFPRPADADKKGSSNTTHKPLTNIPEGSSSSLATDLIPVVNTQPPSKDTAEKWLSKSAYEAYLRGDQKCLDKKHYIDDKDIFSAEHNIGIGIDPDTGTQDGTRIYSASYLRLKSDFSLGIISSCMDKGANDKLAADLLAKTFLNSGHVNQILAGGQQRTCTVLRNEINNDNKIPLPYGPEITGNLVRWTLLTPAIFPELIDKHTHSGGWLPTWICPDNRKVMLKNRPTRQKGQCRSDWRKAIKDATETIGATLVAAMIPRAIPVTGWSLGHADSKFGAKATHLAVPAGSVYYFECDSPESAKALAAALNWHGADTTAQTIVNRRSTLMGEKGFGLGVCSTWQAHPGQAH